VAPDVHATVEAHPEVREQEALADALREEARLESSQGRPDLGLTAVSQSFTREPRTGGVGLILSLPLIDHGSRRNRIAELRRSEEAQRLRAQAARLRIRTDLERALERARAAENGLGLLEGDILPRSERLLAASRVGFQAGHTSVVAYLEAQRTYRSARTEAIEARAEVALAHAELARVVGGRP
jgi:cobalt-zinc-cadmium efflux system outer membrane protein